MDLSQDENRLKTIKAKKMMLLFSMLSISMTFAGLTSAYIVSKSRPDWLKEFELPIAFTISTIVILLSSISIWIAKKNVKKNNVSNTSLWLFITFGLGIIFIVSQFSGFKELISQGYFFTGAQSTITTSFLYVLTVLHLIHLFAGIIVLIVVITNNYKGKYETKKLGFELAVTFWHFLGFLWLYLFIFLYFFR
ncbi:MAG: heme-copper oxidase subunit III [Flavobacteriaceae bacterium]|jgi:cytochrome c oxidase subunit 3|nr:cytochrome c oxidase subunit 3 [Pelagibacterales bacterium]MBT6169273.1 heme-copper oxidase subunit III [Flavobacteriaceae bacterium]MBT6448283.1 heme-copper oxidase subunit III [Flavobacteriaceae bacterium]MBT7624213.1 heme-copper oxidase subunit III [Flavobacteriaceae bacterium]MDG1830886.1 cytochrome c oxidase subunit 3 [Flavobacteriaceae bacterium]|tara:strand:- start:199 stop:777 length:579 start_codon:yes stop_codon:yes gene_type:complete